ncbi:uncharacterized protein LOC114304745, partial [Camellia sinensis]|uniref:uncharacterized protein LOC114304745 n=1 Tax=Camellia sinensis TaxID=4442 RepID=UPI0010367B1B
MIEGTTSEQFAMLWGYVEEIRSSNPGTTIFMKVKELPKVHKEDEQMSFEGKGLIDAVAELFPNASYKFCVRHLYNNFKGQFKGRVLKDLLWKAARATTVGVFTKVMKEMKGVDEEAYNWLARRAPIHWSRSHFHSFPKCDILLNNLCECFNASILQARDQPVLFMLEKIRVLLMETIQKRNEAMKTYNRSDICPKIQKILEKVKVDLKEWTCECRKWDLSGLPCVHVVVIANYMSEEPENQYGKVLPPDVKKRAGRPRLKKRKDTDVPIDATDS